MSFFDSHAHLTDSQFDSDRAEVIRRAKEAGLSGFITAGCDLADSRKVVALTKEYPGFVYAAVGMHPVDGGNEEFNYAEFLKLARENSVVAIGECGLDYHKIKNEKLEIRSEKQEELLIRHIELSREVGKPLMIHCRSAYDELIGILTTHNSFTPSGVEGLLATPFPGMIHFFSGTIDQARKLLDLGFYLSFGGVVTFTRDYDEVIRFVPSDRLLSETDSPLVAPVPYRGKRNEPAYVTEVVRKLAEIRGISLEVIAEAIQQNAKKLFRFN